MISLPALEEVFSALFPPDENGPMVAVEGIEKDNRKYVYLFNRNAMEVSEANRLLQDAGGGEGGCSMEREQSDQKS
jgi:hypothetical protein